jgi:hypothetical protein
MKPANAWQEQRPARDKQADRTAVSFGMAPRRDASVDGFHLLDVTAPARARRIRRSGAYEPGARPKRSDHTDATLGNPTLRPVLQDRFASLNRSYDKQYKGRVAEPRPSSKAASGSSRRSGPTSLTERMGPGLRKRAWTKSINNCFVCFLHHDGCGQRWSLPRLKSTGKFCLAGTGSAFSPSVDQGLGAIVAST